MLDLDSELINHTTDDDAMRELMGRGISIDLLNDPDLQDILDFQIKHYRDNSKPATVAVLDEQFEYEWSEPQTALNDLLERLRTRYVKNKGFDKIEQAAREALDNPLELPTKLIRYGQDLRELVDDRGEVYGRGDFHRVLHDYDMQVAAGRGPSFGFDEVDDHFYGMRGLNFTIGPPKSWKSWMEIRAALANILANKSVYLYSLELPAKETTMRLHCMMANIPYWKYLKNAISENDRRYLKEQAEVLDSYNSFFIEKPESGKRDVDNLILRARDAGADVIMIDQLQYVENGRGQNLGGLNDTGEYWKVCERLRDHSDHIPIHVVHQFNREVRDSDSMPDFQFIKGSAGIEETATLALGLWANKDMRASNIVNLGTLVTRNFGKPMWQIGVELNKGCSFTLECEVTE